ncbi:hypothetical protein I4F81_006059 [Pyropia yezoensis]|uniref:Uncharacterized protein n=1 Tax=Pyropia yezoensis TaxID=2788 RepID=A0ACC3C055_PYRYE|nr:hypothetical protein I4F81_006059 [Neopyropia yezoensis]
MIAATSQILSVPDRRGHPYLILPVAFHPASYVPSAHFSPINVAAHTDAYTMWLPGGYATPGMKDVAETGSTAAMRASLAAYEAAGHVASWDTGAPAAVPPVTTESLTVTANGEAGASLLSGASMLAPSPDWFVGMSRVQLCNGTSWLPAVRGGLGLWDAGTDSGTALTSADVATAPPTAIRRFGLDAFPQMGQMYGTWVAEQI